MRHILKLFIICFIWIGCESEEKVVDVVMKESIIPDNATNVSLRPRFGFKSLYGSVRVEYQFFCDTENPPKTVIASASNNASNVLSYETVLLNPNTKYYWYCKALKDGKEFYTDVYTFTTVDINILNDNHWHLEYILSNTVYKDIDPSDFYIYDITWDSSLIYGEPYGFTVEADSVHDVYRSGDYNEILPASGPYSFDMQTMKIIDWTYEFINLGVDQYQEYDNFANKVKLVLQQPHSDNVLILKLDQ